MAHGVEDKQMRSGVALVRKVGDEEWSGRVTDKQTALQKLYCIFIQITFRFLPLPS